MHDHHSDQLDRIERKVDHLHDIAHAILDSVDELAQCGKDDAKLAALSAQIKKKTAALKAAVKANQPK